MRAATSALGFHLNWYEGRTGYLPGSWDVLWSLSIEEVFYLGFPLVCFGLRRNRVLIPFLALFALSLPISRAMLAGNPIWQEKAYWPGMSAIAAGVLAALIAARFNPRLSVARWLGGVGVTGIIAVLGVEDPLWKYLGNGTLLLLVVSTVCLVLAFHWESAREDNLRIPGTGWLRSFGRLSYEVYLTHMFVVWFVVRLFKHFGAGLWWGYLWYIPAVACSWLMGWLVARYFSVPIERMIRDRVLEALKPNSP